MSYALELTGLLIGLLIIGAVLTMAVDGFRNRGKQKAEWF